MLFSKLGFNITLYLYRVGQNGHTLDLGILTRQANYLHRFVSFQQENQGVYFKIRNHRHYLCKYLRYGKSHCLVTLPPQSIFVL